MTRRLVVALALFVLAPYAGCDSASPSNTEEEFGPGACCTHEGQCEILTSESCGLAIGYYLGEGTTCDGVVCAEGACCAEDGSCTTGSGEGTCPEGAEYMGDGTDCDDSPCGCTPVCGDKECGEDGCGGTCGTCPDGESCVEGYCCEGDPGPTSCTVTDAEFVLPLRPSLSGLGPDPFEEPAVAVGTSSGGVVYSLADCERLYPPAGQQLPGSHAYGLLVHDHTPAGGDTLVSMFSYGPGGAWWQVLTNGAPGMTTIGTADKVTSAVTVTGVDGDENIVAVRYAEEPALNRVDHYTWRASPNPGWTAAYAPLFDRSDFPDWTGNLISVWGEAAGGSLVALSHRGEVGHADLAGDTFTTVATLEGAEPDTRQLACAGDCCVVPRWDQAELAVVPWTGLGEWSGTPEIIDFVAHCPGAGIWAVDGGYWVTGADFEGGSYALTVLDADCHEVSTQTLPLTDYGCVNPTTVALLFDAADAPESFAVACNGSDKVVRIPVPAD